MKRKLALSLIFALFVPFVSLWGGGQRAAAPAPQAGGKPVLSLGIPANQFVSDYNDNHLTNLLEEKFNVEFVFNMLPSAATEALTRIALMVASNDLPDVLLNTGFTDEAILDYGSKGAFIPLNKWMDDPAMSPNFHALPENVQQEILNATTSPDGNIYTMSQYGPNIYNATSHRLFFNKAWAEKLGVPVPTTTDELRTALIAFRDRDPNGNGRRDEVGITGMFTPGYGTNVINALINSFVFYSENNLALDASGNKVISAFTEPNFRKALIYLNGLYKDNVLPASIFTNDDNQRRAMLNLDVPVVGFTSAGSTDSWANVDSNPNFIQMVLIPPLKGPDGIAYTPYSVQTPAKIVAISSRCQNPELAFKIFEGFYDPDMSEIGRYGIEGVDFTKDPEICSQYSTAYVAIGLEERVPRVILNNTWDNVSNPCNSHWHNAHPTVGQLDGPSMNADLGVFWDQSLPTAMIFAHNYLWYSDARPEKVIPRLSYTLEEARRIAQSSTNVREYVRQSIAEFVTSARDINNDRAWNDYITELNNMGLQTWISESQTAFDRLNK